MQGQADGLDRKCDHLIDSFMILFAFFVFRATVLFDKSDVKASRQSFVRKLSVAEPYNPFSLGFNFAFGIGKDLDPSIGVYTLNYVIQKSNNSTSTKIKTKIPLTHSPCNFTNFGYSDQQQFSESLVPTLRCIDQGQVDTQLQGDYYSQNYTYIEVQLQRCQNSNTSTVICKTKEEIQNYFTLQRFWVLYVNSYFDFKSFGQEINYYLDDSLYYDLERDASKQTNIFIQRNLIKLQDDYVQYGQSQDKEFFQIQKALLNVDDNAYDNLNYIRAFIRMDKNYDIYERQIYSLGQILGELGGLKTSLFLIFSTLVGIYAQKITYLKISQEIFQVKSKHHKVQKNQKIQATNFIQEQGKKKFTIEKEDMEKRRISAISQPQNKSGYSKENQKLDKSFIKTNSQDKIQQELDVVSIIKKLRSLDTMMKFMFNPLERLALKYQKQNVLDSSSDYEGKAEETALKSKDIKFLKVLENNNSHSFTKKFLKKKLGYYLNRKSSRQTSAPNIELIKGIASKSSNVEIYDELRKSSGKLPNKEPLNIEGSIDFSKLGIELITPSLASSNNHSPNDQSINNEEITEQNLEQSTFQVDKTHLEDSTQRLAQNSASRFLSIKSYKRPKKNISNVDLFNVPEKELLGSSTKITKTPNIQKKFKY
eukprot:403355792